MNICVDGNKSFALQSGVTQLKKQSGGRHEDFLRHSERDEIFRQQERLSLHTCQQFNNYTKFYEMYI